MAETYDRTPNRRIDEDWEPKNDPGRFDSDPLAELARLIDEDPFADMARPAAATPQAGQASSRPAGPSGPVASPAAPSAPARPASSSYAAREPSPYDAIASRPHQAPSPAASGASGSPAADDDIGDYLIREMEGALGENQIKPSGVESTKTQTEAPSKPVMPPQRRLTSARDTSFGYTPSRADPQPTAPKPVAPAAPMPSAARSAATQPPAEPAVRSADASPDVDRLLADISAAHATHIEQNDDFDFDEAFGENDEGFVWYDEPAAAAEPSRDSAAYRSAPARAEESAADWDVPARQTGHDEADIDEQEEEERESFQADDYEDGEAAMFEAEDADPYAALGSFPVRARPAVHAAAVPAPGPESRASNPAAKVQTPPPAVELGEPVHFEPDAPAAAPEPNAQALWPEAQRRQEQPAAPEAKAPVAEPRHSTAQPGPRVTGAATAAYAAAPRAQAHPAPRIESGPRFEAVERAPAARDLRDDAHFEAMMEQELDFSEFDPSFDDSGHMPPLSDEEAADFGTHPGTERTGRSRGIFLVGALVALIVAGGAGVLAYNSIFSETAGGEPPTLAARDGPVKTKPADPGGAEIPNQNKLVYDRLGGNDQPAEERVVPREEQVDQPSGDSPVRVIGTNVVPRGEEGRVASEQIPSARDATLASQPTADQKAAAPLTAAPAPDQPKRVKTVVVKPDGTVIGQPQAPVTPAPVQLPSAPQRVADAPAAPSRQSEDASAARDAQAPAPTQQVNNVPSGRPLSLTPSNINNAAPSPTPAPAAAPTRVAAAQPAAPVSTSAGPAGTYVVQVASRKSEDQAQSAVSSIQSRYNSALGGHVPRIERADLGDKGVYYRVGVGPISSQQEAVSICERLKSAGQDCFVRRN